jgi:hypothetical protein
LRPVDFFTLRVDGDSNAPFRLVVAISVTTASLNECLNFRTVEIGTHNPHSLAITPIKLAVFFIEMDLLRRECAAFGNDDLAIFSVDVGALDGTVVQAGNAHVGPVNMTRFNVDHDAIAVSAIAHDRLAIGAVRVHRMNTATAQFENKQSADRSFAARRTF